MPRHSPHAKLSLEQVEQLRYRATAGESVSSLAAAFGISRQSVNKVQIGAAYPHVGGPRRVEATVVLHPDIHIPPGKRLVLHVGFAAVP